MIIDIEYWLWKSDFGTFKDPSIVMSIQKIQINLTHHRRNITKLMLICNMKRVNGQLQFFFQTLLHLSRHSKVFLLRPSLFVRNSHKKLVGGHLPYFSHPLLRRRSAHSGVRRTQVGRGAQIGVNGAVGLLVSASSFSTSDMKWRNPKYNVLETRTFYKKWIDFLKNDSISKFSNNIWTHINFIQVLENISWDIIYRNIFWMII